MVTNDRGRTPADPCGEYFCGPLDLDAWYSAASRELQTGQGLRPKMEPVEVREHDRLLVAYNDLPPRVAWALTDKQETTTRAANLAQKARCLWWAVAERAREPPPAPVPVPPPVTPEPKPAEDDSSSWTDWLPAFPGLPTFPGLPGFDFTRMLPILILLGIVLVVVSPGRRGSK